MSKTSPRRYFLKATSLMALALPTALAAAEIPAPGETKKPTVVRTKELRERESNKRLWTLHQSATSRTNLVEMHGEGQPHIHPDAEHSLYVISGDLTATVEGEVIELHTGDYISIPAGVRHGYTVPPGKMALLISMDAPPYDPAKTIR